MSSAMDVHIMTLSLGAFLGATELPLARVPSHGGGICVVGAHLVGPSSGTVVTGVLVTMTDAGTPAINGTIGAFAGTAVTAAGVALPLTIATPYVAAPSWIGFDQASGTVPAGTFISVSYIMGKGPA